MGIVMILTIINIVTLMVEIAVDPMPIQIGAQNAYALKIRTQHHTARWNTIFSHIYLLER